MRPRSPVPALCLGEAFSSGLDSPAAERTGIQLVAVELPPDTDPLDLWVALPAEFGTFWETAGETIAGIGICLGIDPAEDWTEELDRVAAAVHLPTADWPTDHVLEPRLLGSVPFTPATGRRLLAHPGADRQMIEQHLARAMIKVTERLGVSSLHLTFLPQSQWDLLGQEGFLQRTDQQYHWLNEGYRTFDEFLSNLASRKRKNLRKERAAALRDGIDIEWVTGSDIREDHWDAFFRFYIETGFRKWGQPYLTRPFFSLVGETMSDQILLVMCKRDGQYIAGALNFIGSETLFGRYWGCVATYPFLHFEVCYYQAIDFAIDKGLKRVEAGAQGPHKIARGYVPRPTYSAHYIPDPAFRDAVERYLQSERRHVEQHIEMLNEHTPFRRTTDESSEV